MTIQEARNELNSIRVARTRIREKQEQIAELRAMQEGVKAIVYDKERVQSSPTNALESTMVSLILKEEELKQATDEWIKKIGDVEKKIGQIGSPTHETVLIENSSRSCRSGRSRKI